jgi:type VI secretion system secreted protein Hcp
MPATPPHTSGTQFVDMFVSITTKEAGVLKGESSDSNHKGEIQVSGFSWGMASPTDVTSGAASGRRQHKPLRIFKTIDGGTSPLCSALVQNQVVKVLTLTARKSSGASVSLPFLVIKLENGRIAKLDMEIPDPSVAGSPTGREIIEVTYQKIEVTYTPQGGTGAGGAPKVFTDEWLQPT